MLNYIHAKGRVPQRELQSVMQVESATLTAAINTMEAKGWVARGQSKTDRRVKDLRLTREGQKLWNSLPDPIATIRARMLRGVDAQEERAAAQILEKAIQNLEHQAKE